MYHMGMELSNSWVRTQHGKPAKSKGLLKNTGKKSPLPPQADDATKHEGKQAQKTES